MQTSATGKPRNKRCAVHAGYTLLELLVALAIVGILAGMITLSAGLAQDEGAVLEQASDTLLRKMEYAAEDAVLSGELLGLFMLPPVPGQGWRYHFQRYRNDWENAAAPLEEVMLPAPLALQLQVEGEAVHFAAKGRDDTVPVIVFDPAGAATPFRLTLSLDTSGRRAVIDSEQGRLQWLNREPRQ